MSFHERFRRRWEEVIQPAVEAVEDMAFSRRRLEAHRVDLRQVSDAVVTEIVTGIANARLILADITTVETVKETTVQHGEKTVKETAFRNGNVMYELGIAHAVRQPQEVLLFRSDADSLLFDVAGVRVVSYDPDGDPKHAREQVTEAIEAALKEIDVTKSFAVKKALDSLDGMSMSLIMNKPGGILYSDILGDVLTNTALVSAIVRLLELGVLETQYSAKLEPPQADAPRGTSYRTDYTYRLTPFGRAVRRAAIDRFGLVKLFRTAELDAMEGTQGDADASPPGPGGG